MQDHPGAPGTARQESTRTIVSTNDGGNATQPRAPGHERPFAALCAAKHGRLSAASTAPGADIPRAPSARAPGQYCQSAAPRAPGHGRPLAITAGVSSHDRLSAASIATVPSPAGQPRLRQVILPRSPATPNTLTSPHTHRDTAHVRTAYHLTTRYAQSHESANPPLSTWWRGAGGEAILSHPTHQVHPAIQVPPQPRSCSTAAAGVLRQPPSRAPPPPRHRGESRNPTSVRSFPRKRESTPPLYRSAMERGPGGESRRRPYPARAKFSASSRPNSASPPKSSGHP